MKAKIKRYVDDKKRPAIKVTWAVNGREELPPVFEIEKALQNLGITFDTDYDLINKERNWYLDWSLEAK